MATGTRCRRCSTGPADDSEKAVDVVLNGYEFQPKLAERYGCSRPYYVFRCALMGRADNDNLRGWADLYRPNPDGGRKLVGVLSGTVCQEYVETTFGDKIDLRSNKDVATVIKLVADGRLDATVQDNAAASYYHGEYKNLRQLGDPARPGFYVIYYRKTERELGTQLDAAIAEGLRSGALESIYKKYNVWNADQERLSYWLDRPWPPADAAPADGVRELGVKAPPQTVVTLAAELARAAVVTVELALLSFPLAVLIGLAVALGRLYGPRSLAAVLTVYVEVIRGTPILFQLFTIYYLLPDLLTAVGLGGLVSSVTPMAAGVLGLAVNYSAYEAENYRAGLLAVPRGQLEAAQALGMTPLTALRRVVVPQALRVVIPPVTNDFIALFKDTAACSIILVGELTRRQNELFNFNRDKIVEIALLTAGLYLMMSYPLSLAARYLERRFDPARPTRRGGGAA